MSLLDEARLPSLKDKIRAEELERLERLHEEKEQEDAKKAKVIKKKSTKK